MPKVHANRPVGGQAAELLRLVIEAGGCWGIVPAVAGSKAGWLVQSHGGNVWFSALSGDRLVKRGLIERAAAPERPLPFSRVGVAYAATPRAVAARGAGSRGKDRGAADAPKPGRPPKPLSQRMARRIGAALGEAAGILHDASSQTGEPLSGEIRLRMKRCARALDEMHAVLRHPQKLAALPALPRSRDPKPYQPPQMTEHTRQWIALAEALEAERRGGTA